MDFYRIYIITEKIEYEFPEDVIEYCLSNNIKCVVDLRYIDLIKTVDPDFYSTMNMKFTELQEIQKIKTPVIYTWVKSKKSVDIPEFLYETIKVYFEGLLILCDSDSLDMITTQLKNYQKKLPELTYRIIKKEEIGKQKLQKV